MRVGVLGTGKMGTGLGRQFAQAGHEVFMGSRDADKGKSAGAALGGSGGTYAEAAAHGDVVLLTTPWTAVEETLSAAGGLEGKVLVDVTNPFGEEGLNEFPGSSAAQEVARMAPGAKVVKGWNHIFSAIANSTPSFGAVPATVFLAGDDAEAKATVATLARDAGYDPVDAGPLASAKLVEAAAGLVIGLAYDQKLGTDIALLLARR
jgi:8-hydroxy-5-deazaflavin:NADPH oxidoreductase